MNIVITTLDQCGIIGRILFNKISLVSNWASNASLYAIVAVLMVPICRRMLRAAGRGVNLVTIVNSAILGVMGAVLLAALAYVTAGYDGSINQDLGAFKDNTTALFTTSAVLSVLGVLMASTILLVLLVRHSQLRAGVSLSLSLPHTLPAFTSFLTCFVPASRH